MWLCVSVGVGVCVCECGFVYVGVCVSVCVCGCVCGGCVKRPDVQIAFIMRSAGTVMRLNIFKLSDVIKKAL
jgi:hypothetical protein